MTDEERAPSEEHGLFSTMWMLRASLLWADPKYLYTGVMDMVDYLVNDEDPVVADALDILAQVALSGRYTPTRLSEDGERPPITGTLQKISDEDVESEAKRFRDLLDKMTTADEPEEGSPDVE